MKPRLSTRREAGLTRLEVGMVIAILAILAVLLFTVLSASHRKSAKIGCTNNLRQIVLAYRMWGSAQRADFPMGISVTNGGSMEQVQTGNVSSTFQVMSVELGTPEIIYCPADASRSPARNFSELGNSNISYFVNADATNTENPQMILSGDCNFEIGGVPVKSGLLSLWTNDPVAWGPTRHVRSGNIALADGSVQSATPSGLRMYFVNTGLATNRLAIP